MKGPFEAKWSVRQYGENIDEGKIGFDNTKQRGLVWNNTTKSLLIDSVISGYPMGIITSVQNEDGDYDILDGKQRLLGALYNYVSGNFKLSGLQQTKYKDKYYDLNEKLFRELPEDIQNTIKDRIVTMEYYEDVTEEEEVEIFKRLNEGKKLTAIEKVRAESNNYDQIRDLANHQLFSVPLGEKKGLILSRIQKNGFVDEDIVLKTYLLVCRNDYNLQTVNVREAMKSSMFTEEEIVQMTRVFDVLLEAIEKIAENKELKKVHTKIKKKTNLLSIVQLVDKVMKDKKNNRGAAAKAIREWIIEFFGSDDIQTTSISERYDELIQKGSSQPENVKERLKIVEDSFSNMN